mgnify:FL=1
MQSKYYPMSERKLPFTYKKNLHPNSIFNSERKYALTVNNFEPGTYQGVLTGHVMYKPSTKVPGGKELYLQVDFPETINGMLVKSSPDIEEFVNEHGAARLKGRLFSFAIKGFQRSDGVFIRYFDTDNQYVE